MKPCTTWMDCYCLKAVKTLSNPRRKENPWAAQRWVAPRYALHALLTSKLLQFQSRQCLWGHCLPPVAPACQPSFCDSPWPNCPMSRFATIGASICVQLAGRTTFWWALGIVAIALAIVALAFAFIWRFALAFAFRTNGLPFSLAFTIVVLAFLLAFAFDQIHLHWCWSSIPTCIGRHSPQWFSANVSQNPVTRPVESNALMGNYQLTNFSIRRGLWHGQLHMTLNISWENTHQRRQKNVIWNVTSRTSAVLISHTF